MEKPRHWNCLPREAQARLIARAASEQAIAEREARFPVLTAANALEAVKWQAERANELMAELVKQLD
jgi:hypothetical protein